MKVFSSLLLSVFVVSQPAHAWSVFDELDESVCEYGLNPFRYFRQLVPTPNPSKEAILRWTQQHTVDRCKNGQLLILGAGDEYDPRIREVCERFLTSVCDRSTIRTDNTDRNSRITCSVTKLDRLKATLANTPPPPLEASLDELPASYRTKTPDSSAPDLKVPKLCLSTFLGRPCPPRPD